MQDALDKAETSNTMQQREQHSMAEQCTERKQTIIKLTDALSTETTRVAGLQSELQVLGWITFWIV